MSGLHPCLWSWSERVNLASTPLPKKKAWAVNQLHTVESNIHFYSLSLSPPPGMLFVHIPWLHMPATSSLFLSFFFFLSPCLKLKPSVFCISFLLFSLKLWSLGLHTWVKLRITGKKRVNPVAPKINREITDVCGFYHPNAREITLTMVIPIV